MPALLADIILSTETLAVVGAVVGTLWAGLVLLWREEGRRVKDQVDDLRRQRDELLRVLYRHDLEDEVPSNVPRAALPKRPGASERGS